MATHADREAFIPLSRRDLLQLILQDSTFAELHGEDFQHFCEVLNAWLHFRYHQQLESLKENFAHLDPDRDTVSIEELGPQAAKQREAALQKTFVEVLEQANYSPLSAQQLQEAFAEDAMIQLNMEIDFEDYQQMVLYWRGATTAPVPQDKWWQRWFVAPHSMEIFKRMVLLLHFKEADYFEAKGQEIDKLGFTPGKMYLYLYKNIPRRDLEVLFPNVKISMTWRDRLMFFIPAMGAAIPMVLKALPQLLLIAGVALFLTLGAESAARLGVGQTQINNFLPIMVALLSLLVLFGSFSFKQYLGYKNKKLKFLKDVTDTLFFRNLVCNGGVFNALIDAAEEEEAKESMLVFYLLLSSPQAHTADSLDDAIENWLCQHKLAVDFDITKALAPLFELSGKAGRLLQREATGILKPLPLPQACHVLDEIWDNLFDFSAAHQAAREK